MAQEVGLREVLQHITARLDSHDQELREVRQEIRDLRREMIELRRDMFSMFRWLIGIQLTMWATLLAAMLVTYFTRLPR
ncbi:MAG: hypothetical protein NZ951_01420 [Dehalococcoidia bacterium]|nr:hypothetical protein [Dehalococcoidia bacterium]MDW8119491.1 hypothetical protein [Chloroflexota bacterium]